MIQDHTKTPAKTPTPTPEYWLAHAHRTRLMADMATDCGVKATMQWVSAMYERMAKWAPLLRGRIT